MRVKELLNLIPQSTWDKLVIETKVNHKAKKLDGQIVFNLLLYSLLNVRENSLRVMEKTFNSFFFQQLQPSQTSRKIRHSSIGERLSSINADFFEKLYHDCVQLHFKHFGDKDNKGVLRFDSTIVSISAKLVDIGFICGGGHDNSRQLKFTVGLSDTPEYGRFNHEPTFNSENVALKQAILDCKSSKDKIVLFDRGIQARDTYDELTENGIVFITRINPDPRCKDQTENKIKVSIETESLIITEDCTKRLINRNQKVTKHSFRYIHGIIKKTGERIAFLTNIETMTAQDISSIYRYRWDIEVFFKFLKQELNFSHLICRNANGIRVVFYTTLILSILLTAYKKLNNLKGYKLTKLSFALELEEELIKYLIEIYGGNPNQNPKNKTSFWNST